MIEQHFEEKKSDLVPIFVYYRISSELQNFGAQKKINNNYLKNHPDKYRVIDIFKDEDISGDLGPEDRDEFNKMINRLDEVDAILCFDWDRISRNLRFATYFMFFLQEANISVIEAGSGKILNFDEMGDRIWTYLKSEMGAEERRKIKMRQKAGIEAFRDKYGRWGPKKKYGGGPKGDSFSKKKFWEKYETMRMANVSKSAIARLFKISPPTLYDRLNEESKRYEEIEKRRNEKYGTQE